MRILSTTAVALAISAAIGRFGFKFAQLYGQGETPMTITVPAAFTTTTPTR